MRLAINTIYVNWRVCSFDQNIEISILDSDGSVEDYCIPFLCTGDYCGKNYASWDDYLECQV